jgi:conjugative transposon TraN protein
MNWYRAIATVLIGTISFNLFGQASIPFLKSSFIPPYKLEVAFNKTTNLIFPAPITSIDRGSEDIIVEKAVGVENILRVKADVKVFEETNLSVITKDGKLYSFLVNYNNNPSYLNVNIESTIPPNNLASVQTEEGIVSSIVMTEQNLKIYCENAISREANIYRVKDKASKMSLSLTGFYVKENVMFCRLTIANASQINFDVEQFRLYIRDKEQSKRTATQENEIIPLYILGDTSEIKGTAKDTLVIAVPKFTIPDGKYLAIEIMESNGGRHLALRVKNRHVVKAKSL